MALGILFYMFVGMTVLSIIFSVLMLVCKNNIIGTTIFWLSGIFSIIITYLSVTSLPTNFILQKCIALLLGLPAIIGMILSLTKYSKMNLSKILVIISLFAGLADLFFF